MSMIGKTLGSFECTALLGRGGMGEVYRAKDQKLGRDVAIKVLPEEFAKDTDRVARFQREAKLLASLNHPNIAAIYGLEESDGTHFLVLELIEGDTLADRLKREAIPVEESLKLALQIAEALEAAHEKGVIHRDLKPANIKVTPDGKVKVLDFGLAKAFAGDQEEMILSDSPTISAAATQKGVILGTAAYMSPEQAKGKAVDRRTDIWAFGAVLYEMLTGQAAFKGDEVSEILASVIKGDINLDLLPASIHPRVRELLSRCLQKDMGRRYSGISDARYEIEQVLSDPNGVFVQPIAVVEPRTKLRTTLPWVFAAIVLTAIIVGAAIWKMRTPERPRVIRLDYVLPEDQQFNIDPNTFGHTLAVSPDGSPFIYSTSGGLYLRFEDDLEARLISGTDKDDPQSPFFSPDGKWVGYWSQAENQLKKIAIGGGAPVALCNVTWLFGAIWNADNAIVYSDVWEGIKSVSANGGTPEMLVKGMTSGPQLLPDGQSIIFTDVTIPAPYRIIVRSLKSGEQKILFAGYAVKYLPTGHLVYWLQNNLYAVPFDLDTLEATDGPVPIIEGARYFAAISDSGTLVYLPGPQITSTDEARRTLVWVDREGKEEALSAEPDAYHYPKISPDGSKIALTITDGENQDIWIWDTVRETMTRLTFYEGQDIQSIWTHDGNRIVFRSARDEGGIYWKAADGTGEVEFLGSAPDRMLLPWSWSSDGNTLVMSEVGSITEIEIGMLSMEGDRAHKRLLQEDYTEMQPKISPDGRWMAYTSNESGQGEIYVRPFPNVDEGKWQVSKDGGLTPLWSPDGKELFYRSPDGIMAVSVDTEPTFKLGKSKFLFGDIYVGLAGGGIEGHSWDIHPDGKRFLMMKKPATTDDESTAEEPRKINIVLNWFEELKERVPVD